MELPLMLALLSVKCLRRSMGAQVRVRAFSGESVADASLMEVYVSNNPNGSWVQVRGRLECAVSEMMLVESTSTI
jgi:hypothetical protein